MHDVLTRKEIDVIADGGQMGALMREHDWSRSPLGDPRGWPPSLCNAVNLMLPARAQITLFWGPQYVALYNDAYAPTIGDKHPRALGRPAAENWSELWDDLEPLLRSVRETGNTVFAKNRPFYIERHGFGEEVFFDISYSSVRTEDGSIGGVLCIVSETTERKRAEDYAIALADERQRHAEDLEALMRALPVGVFVARDAACADITMNPAGAAMLRMPEGGNASKTGPAPEQLPFRVLKNGAEVPSADLPMQRAARLGKPVVGDELDIVFTDGGAATLYEYASPLFDARGQVRGCLGVFVDITKRKQDETSLRESQAAQRSTNELLSAVISASPVPVIVIDPAATVRVWNKAAEHVFGWSEEEVLGKALPIVPDEKLEECRSARAAIARGEIFTGFETYRRRKGGSRIDVKIFGARLTDADGNVTGAVLLCDDISDQKRAEERQRLLTNELNHRVKNTLTIVQSLASQTARFTPEPDAFKAALGNRIAALSGVHDVLTKASWSGASLDKVANASLAPFNGGQGQAVRVKGPDARIDATTAVTLSLAFHELATNAVKYGALREPQGYIALEWAIAGDPPRIDLVWAEHDGPQVAPPTREGFGNRLIRSLAAQLDGQIDLEYRPDGVRCRISMPLADQSGVPR